MLTVEYKYISLIMNKALRMKANTSNLFQKTTFGQYQGCIKYSTLCVCVRVRVRACVCVSVEMGLRMKRISFPIRDKILLQKRLEQLLEIRLIIKIKINKFSYHL